MADRDKIINYINEYLEVANFSDGCINGLQVEGKPEVNKIISAVSLNIELINQAIKKNADMILVHHGFWGKGFFELKSIRKERVKSILVNDINVAGYHLPLDIHPEIGNNILILKKLGLQMVEKMQFGWVGKYDKSINIDNFIKKINQLLKTKSYTIKAGIDQVKQVGIVSGGGSSYLVEAVEKGADTFICGDISEHIPHLVKEIKINFINAGHYRTERFGIQALGDLIAKKFKVDVEFVEIDNEV